MSADVPRGPELRWLAADDYHTRTSCGRFTVARRRVSGIDWYVAYRRDGARSVELGATQVSPRATDAERSAAIRDMKALCEAALDDQPTKGDAECLH